MRRKRGYFELVSLFAMHLGLKRNRLPYLDLWHIYLLLVLPYFISEVSNDAKTVKSDQNFWSLDAHYT